MHSYKDSPLSLTNLYNYPSMFQVFYQSLRAWKKPILCVFDNLRHLLRNIGLNISNFLLDHLLNDRVEPKKVVVNTSFWIAFSRCWVHILPVSISIFLIQLNLRGHYVGEHLRGPTSDSKDDSVTLAFIQVAAKALVGSCQSIIMLSLLNDL